MCRRVMKALHLPHDMLSTALFARVADGGLGIQIFSTLILALKRVVYKRLAASNDTRVAGLGRKYLNLQGLSQKDLLAAATQLRCEQLYESANGRGLQCTDQFPPTHKWVHDGTLLIPGHAYINAFKMRLGLISQRLWSSKGRLSVPVLCNLGCGHIELLGHIWRMWSKYLWPSAPNVMTMYVLTLLTKLLLKKHLEVRR
ncbi:Retrovirus-related Pol polyprotein from type-1 retrotransposable element R2 [Portunus trituberculatus]|uniref:Retrovirus-related Pol polyprotein from type-1 retrotransposable element R2 n=1 Tax=Portunus trituberculatus TaxID=210409 RepID=A0A5B7H4M1_PORTR|nr:Retrovirus-related Pol polyprotein from type-1 retrotransposable element R2 [Portunus trituberculatus]